MLNFIYELHSPFSFESSLLNLNILVWRKCDIFLYFYGRIVRSDWSVQKTAILTVNIIYWGKTKSYKWVSIKCKHCTPCWCFNFNRWLALMFWMLLSSYMIRLRVILKVTIFNCTVAMKSYSYIISLNIHHYVSLL